MLDNIELISREYITAKNVNEAYENGLIGNPFYHDMHLRYGLGLIESGYYDFLAKEYEGGGIGVVLACYENTINDKYIQFLKRYINKQHMCIEYVLTLFGKIMSDEIDKEIFVKLKNILVEYLERQQILLYKNAK